MLLEKKIALVTGAGRGLGREHALALARAGAIVVVNDLGGSGTGGGSDDAPARSVVEEIVAFGGEAVADGTDVGNWSDAQGLVEGTIDRFGQLDIVVNNAGISRIARLEEVTEADWDATLSVNLKGSAALIAAAARHWRTVGPAGCRAIVNTSSPAGPHAVSPIGVYGASKAGVIALTQVAAQELADLGVRVNAIAPMARTRLVDAAPELVALMPRSADFDRFEPEHVAQLVVYLSSSLCGFTGRLFGIEGDDVFLFHEASAELHASNDRRKWTPEALATALGAFPRQDLRWGLFPGGRVEERSPTDMALAALDNAGGEK